MPLSTMVLLAPWPLPAHPACGWSLCLQCSAGGRRESGGGGSDPMRLTARLPLDSPLRRPKPASLPTASPFPAQTALLGLALYSTVVGAGRPDGFVAADGGRRAQARHLGISEAAGRAPLVSKEGKSGVPCSPGTCRTQASPAVGPASPSLCLLLDSPAMLLLVSLFVLRDSIQSLRRVFSGICFVL